MYGKEEVALRRSSAAMTLANHSFDAGPISVWTPSGGAAFCGPLAHLPAQS